MRFSLCCAPAIFAVSTAVAAQEISKPKLGDIVDAVMTLCAMPDRLEDKWSVIARDGVEVEIKMVNFDGSARFTSTEWDGIKDYVQKHPGLNHCTTELTPKFIQRIGGEKIRPINMRIREWEFRGDSLRSIKRICEPWRTCLSRAESEPTLDSATANPLDCKFQVGHGAYRCNIQAQENFIRDAKTNLPASNQFYLSVTVIMSENSSDLVAAGLYFGKSSSRGESPGQAYHFIISAEGSSALLKATLCERSPESFCHYESLIAMGPMPNFNKSEPQKLEVYVRNNLLELFIEGEPMEIPEGLSIDYRRGRFGLVVGAFSENDRGKVEFNELRYYGEQRGRSIPPIQ